jgi:hypothetical protein
VYLTIIGTIFPAYTSAPKNAAIGHISTSTTDKIDYQVEMDYKMTVKEAVLKQYLRKMWQQHHELQLLRGYRVVLFFSHKLSHLCFVKPAINNHTK